AVDSRGNAYSPPKTPFYPDPAGPPHSRILRSFRRPPPLLVRGCGAPNASWPGRQKVRAGFLGPNVANPISRVDALPAMRSAADPLQRRACRGSQAFALETPPPPTRQDRRRALDGPGEKVESLRSADLAPGAFPQRGPLPLSFWPQCREPRP